MNTSNRHFRPEGHHHQGMVGGRHNNVSSYHNSRSPQYYTHWEVSEEDDEEEEDDRQPHDQSRNIKNGTIPPRSPHHAHNGHPQHEPPPPHHHRPKADEVGAVVAKEESQHQVLVENNRNGDVVVGRSTLNEQNGGPRRKFNVEFEYEDTIETSSSAGSFSSGYARPTSHSVGQSPSHHPLHHNYQHPSQHVRYHPGHPREMSGPRGNPHHHGLRGNSDIPEKFRDEKDGSEIYVVDTAYMKPPASVYSHYSGKSRAPSEAPSSVKTKTSRKGGVVVETMSAPNPCCPNTKGVCWLLVLINLGLILVTLGFSIVLQLFDPPFVWYFGIAFLIVGFTALIASLIFCLHLCRESENQSRRGLQPGEMYWTHHWQKRIPLPGMTRHSVEKADDVSTVYSGGGGGGGRNDPDVLHYPRDDRRDMNPIHTYNHHQQHH